LIAYNGTGTYDSQPVQPHDTFMKQFRTLAFQLRCVATS